MEITAKVLAEALREAMNPTINERLALQERPTPEVEPVRVKCVSPTGAHFTAIVVPSRAFPQGRVVKIEDYLYPASAALRAAGMSCVDGPDAITLSGNLYYPQGHERAGRLTPDAKQHVWETTYQADLRDFVGKPIHWNHRADTQDIVRDMQAKVASAGVAALAEATATAAATEPARKGK